MDEKGVLTVEGKEAAKNMAQWFRDNKARAYWGDGLYRVKMNEEWYDAFTVQFEKLANGDIINSSELIERVNSLTKMVAYKMSKSGNGENVEYVQLNQVIALLSPKITTEAPRADQT